MQSTYDAVEGGPEFVGNHRQKLLLDAHALLKVLNQLQPARVAWDTSCGTLCVAWGASWGAEGYMTGGVCHRVHGCSWGACIQHITLASMQACKKGTNQVTPGLHHGYIRGCVMGYLMGYFLGCMGYIKGYIKGYISSCLG